MTVLKDCVMGEGFGAGSPEDDHRTTMMAGGLISLLHFADQQWFSGTTDEYYEEKMSEFLKDGNWYGMA